MGQIWENPLRTVNRVVSAFSTTVFMASWRWLYNVSTSLSWSTCRIVEPKSRGWLCTIELRSSYMQIASSAKWRQFGTWHCQQSVIVPNCIKFYKLNNPSSEYRKWQIARVQCSTIIVCMWYYGSWQPETVTSISWGKANLQQTAPLKTMYYMCVKTWQGEDFSVVWIHDQAERQVWLDTSYASEKCSFGSSLARYFFILYLHVKCCAHRERFWEVQFTMKFFWKKK